jgi:hypothetical protein
VAVLPEGKDPDDAVREWGAEGFRELLDQRLGLVEYRLKTIFARHQQEGPEGRTKAAREAVGVLSEVPDVARRMALLAWAADAWAGADVSRAAFLERALLQEMERRARDLAPAERDEWQRVLAEKGFPQRGPAGRGRRLSRREWLEWQHRHEPLLRDVRVAQGAGLPPHAPDSPTSLDSVSEALARALAPYVVKAMRLERRMLTAMLQRAEVAQAVLQRVRPEEMLLPIHREIAAAVAGPDGRPEPEQVASAIERLSRDEAVFAAAVEIGVAEDTYEIEQLDRDIAFLREARLLGGKALRLYRANDELIDPLHDGESLEELERRVQQGLADGSLTRDDPLFERYMTIRRRFGGKNELAWWDFD